MMDRFTLFIPCKKEYVSTARITATSIAGVVGFDIEKIEDIRLAVGEACNNAVIHSRDQKDIRIQMEYDRSMIRISVRDGGIGFVPKEITLDEEYKGSGLGLFIIDSLMDEVNIDSACDEGTCITMVKRL